MDSGGCVRFSAVLYSGTDRPEFCAGSCVPLELRTHQNTARDAGSAGIEGRKQCMANVSNCESFSNFPPVSSLVLSVSVLFCYLECSLVAKFYHCAHDDNGFFFK